MTRMYVISKLVGINTAAFAYFGVFRHVKWYFGLPLTVVTFALARNFSMKGSISRLYYPLEPVYDEIRRHQSKSESNPQGAVGIRDIQKSTEAFEPTRVPLLERDDISKADKRKIMK